MGNVALKTKTDRQTEALVACVIEGLQEKKGIEIVALDLRAVPNAVASFFIIASGNTDKHTSALGDSVENVARETLGEKPWHTEGYRRGEWIVLDYVDVVVHIFIPRIRSFYKLEELWADAHTTRYD